MIQFIREGPHPGIDLIDCIMKVCMMPSFRQTKPESISRLFFSFLFFSHVNFKTKFGSHPVFSDFIIVYDGVLILNPNGADILQCFGCMRNGGLSGIFPAFGGICHYFDYFYDTHKINFKVYNKNSEMGQDISNITVMTIPE